MPPLDLAPVSGRYLSLTEREEIAVLLARGCGVREIARQLGRAPSTISRELQRNAALRTVGLSIEPRPPKLMRTVARDARSRRSSL
jgi:IS30 family transposase